jgi:hypothetical protein
MNSPFNNLILRNWFIQNLEILSIGIDDVVTLGSGPFEETDFDEFLKKNGITPCEPSDEIETVVVGADDWEQLKLLEMLTLRKGKTLKVYSQEMFLSYLFTATDPFLSSRNILIEFANDHPALQFLSTLGFQWPSTRIVPSILGNNLISDWPKKGLLGWLNYRVGRKGLPSNRRRAILARAFEEDFTLGFPTTYLKDWGKPASPQRLKKMAHSVAAFCRNAKRRQSHQAKSAIDDWETDLDWLRRAFYDPLGFRFVWPQTDV